MIKFSSIMIGSSDPKKLADFYEKVFDKKSDWSQEDWFGFKLGENFITIGPHSEVGEKAKEPQRMFVNYYSDDVKGDFERVSKIEGTKVVKEPYKPDEKQEMWISTFEDPDGNYFQIATPWKQ